MLYNSYCAPTTYSSADGAYVGFDGAVHAAAPGAAFVSDLSLWDIYRTQAPLLALTLPRALSNIASSLAAMAAQGGSLPRWPFANLYTHTMVGEHGVHVLADCVLHSDACAGGALTLPDAAAIVLAAVQAQAARVPAYAAPGGWAPFPAQPASDTLDFAYDDATAAAFAAAVGDAPAAALHAERAAHFLATWLPAAANASGGVYGDTNVFAPRADNGTFVSDDALWAPHPFNKYYVEGNAAHYLFAVPHNVSGLVAQFPGASAGARADAFAAVLETVLANQTYWNDALSTFLPNPWAWVGNEPSLLLPWMHAWAGPQHAWRAQFWPRWHLRTYWTPTVDGLPGNDDYGTTSAWAVWAYLGLYPVGGQGVYALGSPVFANVTVTTPDGWGPLSGGIAAAGATLTIVAHNASAANIFVAGAAVNGVALTEPLVTAAQLWPAGTAAGGATLEFFMTSEAGAFNRVACC